MASTKESRVKEMNDLLLRTNGNVDLMNKVIKLKLNEGIFTYKTVQEYIENVFNDNNDFDTEALKPLIEMRVESTESKYKNDLNNLVTELSNDSRYTKKIKKSDTESQSFIEYLQGLKIGNISFEDKTLLFGAGRISIEDAFNKFSNDLNRYDEKMLEEIKAEELQDNREFLSKLCFEIGDELGLGFDEAKEILSDYELSNYLFNELASDTENILRMSNENTLKDMISSKLKEKMNKEETKETDQVIKPKGPESMEEIGLDNFHLPYTDSTSLLFESEKDQLLKEYSKRTDIVNEISIGKSVGSTDDNVAIVQSVQPSSFPDDNITFVQSAQPFRLTEGDEDEEEVADPQYEETVIVKDVQPVIQDQAQIKIR